jgi:hypothetical protein
VKQLKDLGFKGVILTYAKEMVFDHKNESANHHTSDKFVDAKAVAAHDTDIEAWRAGTLRTLDLISEGDILALKYVSQQERIKGRKYIITDTTAEQREVAPQSQWHSAEANCHLNRCLTP